MCVFIGLAVLPTLALPISNCWKTPPLLFIPYLKLRPYGFYYPFLPYFSLSLSLSAFLVFLFTDWLAFHMLSHPLYQATSVTIIRILFLDAMAMCFVLGFICAFDVVVVVLLFAAALDGFDVVRFTCRFFFFLICGRSFCNLL